MQKAFKPCRKLGCPNLTRETYCSTHKEQRKINNKQYDNQIRNQEHRSFYHSKEWKAVRLIALTRDNFICVECKKNNKITKAEIVDHVIELRDDYSKRLELTNLQSLCRPCHNTKTEQERKKRNKNK